MKLVAGENGPREYQPKALRMTGSLGDPGGCSWWLESEYLRPAVRVALMALKDNPKSGNADGRRKV